MEKEIRPSDGTIDSSSTNILKAEIKWRKSISMSIKTEKILLNLQHNNNKRINEETLSDQQKKSKLTQLNEDEINVCFTCNGIGHKSKR